MELEFCRQIFDKYINIKFHKNFAKWGIIFQCGKRNDRQRDEPRTDMTKPGVAVCIFANAAKTESGKMNSCGNFSDST
jgi:hypothetical protein